MLSLGFAWALAPLDVLIRDVGQPIGIVTAVMIFLAPVFFPVTSLPETYRPVIMANPLIFIIEQAREVLIWSHPPNWTGLDIYTLAAIAVAWFQQTERDLPMYSANRLFPFSSNQVEK